LQLLKLFLPSCVGRPCHILVFVSIYSAASGSVFRCFFQCSKWKFRSVGIHLKSETRICHKENVKQMNIVYIDKCRYEIQKPKEVPLMVYRHIPAHFKHWFVPNDLAISCHSFVIVVRIHVVPSYCLFCLLRLRSAILYPATVLNKRLLHVLSVSFVIIQHLKHTRPQ